MEIGAVVRQALGAAVALGVVLSGAGAAGAQEAGGKAEPPAPSSKSEKPWRPQPGAGRRAPADEGTGTGVKGEEGKGREEEPKTGGPRPVEPKLEQSRFGAELLWWSLSHGSVPPLATRGNLVNGGILGQQGTKILLGDLDDVQTHFVGARFSGAGWIDRKHNLGIEGAVSWLGPSSGEFTTTGSGAPGSAVVARPFFNTTTNEEDAFLVAAPGLQSGRLTVNGSAQMQQVDTDVVYNILERVRHWVNPVNRVEVMVGPTYLHVGEELNFRQRSTQLADGSQMRIADHFSTDNHFFGGQVGVRWRWSHSRLNGDLFGKLAGGVNCESVEINGQTVSTDALGNSTRTPGGFLALAGNSGQFSRTEPTGVSQLGANVGYQMTRHWRAVLGYQFLLLGVAARPGDEISTSVNPSFVPANGLTPDGPAAPTFAFRTTDFATQGLNVGLQIRY